MEKSVSMRFYKRENGQEITKHVHEKRTLTSTSENMAEMLATARNSYYYPIDIKTCGERKPYGFAIPK